MLLLYYKGFFSLTLFVKIIVNDYKFINEAYVIVNEKRLQLKKRTFSFISVLLLIYGCTNGVMNLTIRFHKILRFYKFQNCLYFTFGFLNAKF